MNYNLDAVINELELPNNWVKGILSNYCKKPQYGYTESAVEKGEIKFLRISDIDRLIVNWFNVPYCKCNQATYEKYKLENGDILFARIGATTGKSYIVFDPPKSIFASYLIRIKTDQEKLNPKFLFYYFQTYLYWKQINQNKANNLKGGVNGTILSGLSIVLPPLPEQHKIAVILSTVQKAIETQAKLIERTTELKKAMMHKLFTEGTRGEKQKMTEIGLLPESWEVVEFEKLVILQRGKDLTKDNFINGNIPVSGSNGIIGYHNVANVKAPGITVGRSGSVGKVVFYSHDFWAHNTCLYVKEWLILGFRVLFD
ncbi:MAG: restriction endonuclease subunit S [Desulfobacterales bacterium]|nr:restriction endonuclease subunit S [Desulfobacterales bacterium]